MYWLLCAFGVDFNYILWNKVNKSSPSTPTGKTHSLSFLIQIRIHFKNTFFGVWCSACTPLIIYNIDSRVDLGWQMTGLQWLVEIENEWQWHWRCDSENFIVHVRERFDRHSGFLIVVNSQYIDYCVLFVLISIIFYETKSIKAAHPHQRDTS